MDLPLVGSGVDGTLIRRSVIDLLFHSSSPCAYVSPMSLDLASLFIFICFCVRYAIPPYDELLLMLSILT